MPSPSIERLKDFYENGPDNIGRDFIRPCLKEASLYRRGAAFFGSTSMITYADALLHVIKDGVKIEILCSPVINDIRLLDTYQNTISEDERIEVIQKFQEEIIYKATKYQEDPDKRKRFGSEILAYLIANEQLEIKIAIRKKEGWPDPWPEDHDIDNHSYLYHVKRGYFVFENDKKISFNGSFNETYGSQQNHTEEVQVYKNWLDADKKRGERTIRNVDRDWNEENKELHIRPLSKDLIKKIKDSVSTHNGKYIRPTNDNSENEESDYHEIDQNETFKLRKYQEEALKKWSDNDCKGILAMATGSGKTKTAIAAIKKFREVHPSGNILILVPKQNLAFQWIEELKINDITPISAFESKRNWYEALSLKTSSAIYNETKGECIVAVNKTFKSDNFRQILDNIRLSKSEANMLVADECHVFNKPHQIDTLPDFFQYRLGLSATPFDQFEEIPEKKYLLNYFDKICFEYSLKEAIDNNFLCKYNYNVIEVYIDEDETEQYEIFTKKIGQALNRSRNSESDSNANLESLLAERAKIVASVKDKYIKLDNLIKNKKYPYALAYCGAGNANEDDVNENTFLTKQVDIVTSIFEKNNQKVSKVTYEENMQTRKEIISQLTKKHIDAIVSIRILDEGIDIPCCQTAFILASRRSLREHVQRRGRILRLSPETNKEIATLYDFVVLSSPSESKAIKNLYKSELERVFRFAEEAQNKSDIINKYESLANEVGLYDEGDLNE